MNSFVVSFANQREWAEQEIAAALKACRIAAEHPRRLDYRRYDRLRPINRIEVLARTSKLSTFPCNYFRCSVVNSTHYE